MQGQTLSYTSRIFADQNIAGPTHLKNSVHEQFLLHARVTASAGKRPERFPPRYTAPYPHVSYSYLFLLFAYPFPTLFLLFSYPFLPFKLDTHFSDQLHF